MKTNKSHNFLFKIYIILLILNLFIKSSILSLIELILIIVIFYRLFCKNNNARIKEFYEFKNNSKYKDGYIYKKCPKCKKTLKLPLPYKKGLKSVICPKCKKNFKMLVLKSEKIEIISKK